MPYFVGFCSILLLFVLFQANSNAREGRVMIFNLVETAQEFLSEVVPVSQSHGSVRLFNHHISAFVCVSKCVYKWYMYYIDILHV